MKLSNPFNVPYERQTEELSCGAACLSMILRSFGISINQQQIWEEIEKKAGVAYVKHMAMYPKRFGIESTIVKVENCTGEIIDFCFANNYRIIILQRNLDNERLGHYVVPFSTDKNHIYLHDPHIDGTGESQRVSRARQKSE